FFAGIWDFFWVLVILLVILLAVIYLSLNRAISLHLQGWLRGRHIHLEQYRLGRKLKEIYQSYQGYRQHKPALALFFVLSLAENLLPIWVNYCLALAFHLEVAPLYFFILVPISLVLIRLPISISGIGVQEGFFVYFLGLIGVANSPALLLGAAGNIIAILSILVGGVLYGISGLNMSAAAKGVSAASPK
ncbi:MAG TPA: lysylphosphatidylglycerol synthase domain-containing protein, partial [Phototrophicaceae bacterium]|nr:lysylphosphatidylglycerol synthase domain-containing protein [Phototrophicaceae bacterium]